MNWKLWLYGLLWAALNAGLNALVLPQIFTKATLREMALVTGYQALFAAVAYMKTHPPDIPKQE